MIPADLEQAITLHQQGRLPEAEAIYREILRKRPDDFDALHLLGVIAMQTGHAQEACDLIRLAIAINPNIAEAHSNLGLVLQGLNRLQEALACYAQAIQLKPDYAEAFYNRGIALQSLKHWEEAVASYTQALRFHPDSIEAYNNRGSVLLALKRPAQALADFDRALRLNPHYAEALGNRGSALLELKQPEQALSSIDQALRIKPDNAESFNNRGVALQNLKRVDEALASYEQAVALDPAYAEAFNNRGNALRTLKRPEEALASYDKALSLKPDYAEAHSNRGAVLLDLNRPVEAQDSYAQVLRLNADLVDADALYHCGNLLHSQKQPELALVSYDHALRINPEFADVYNNRGNALLDLMRPEDALQSYARALQIRPGFAEALNNQGNAQLSLRRPQAALDSYTLALRLRNDLADAYCNESLCRLLIGDYEQGLQHYERRWETEAFAARRQHFNQPPWLGQESLQGKTILLHAEQGLGDTIQFCRYAKRVAELGAKVLLEVQGTLKPLLVDLEGASQVFAHGEPLPAFDCHCPLMSLPLALGTRVESIPAQARYLQADPVYIRRWQERLGEKTAPRIGLVWSGNPDHKNDRTRSIPFAAFSKLVNGPAQFISLQKDIRAADRPAFEECQNIADLGGELSDFADTAGLAAHLDLLIAADTAVAHLAAAMGKPVWLLLPFSPDWRWLLDRDDSPWYPSIRLFRQTRFADWAGLISRVADELDAFLPPRQTNRSSLAPAQDRCDTSAPYERTSLLEKTNHAIALHQHGRISEAEALYREILQADPRHFDALHLLGVIALQSGDNQRACDLIDTAIAINPQDPVAHSNLGVALRALKRPEEALAHFDRALQLQPDYADALLNRGTVLQDLKLPQQALADYEQALRLKPDAADINTNFGTALLTLQRPEEALTAFERALQANPNHAEAHNNRGAALLDLKRPREALTAFERALDINPAYAEAHNGRGLALQDLKHPEEALACYDTALQLRPDYAEAFSNRGNALTDLRRINEALLSYAQAVRIRPDYVEVHWNESLCRLTMGDFKRGWQQYEWRWQIEAFKAYRRHSKQTLWLGKASLRGKTLLLHAEQGLGDTLQFCRYAKPVAARGARVLLEVPTELKSLLARLEGVHQIIGQDEPLPPFDYHCPLLSLPLAFNTRLETIPARKPYLHADPRLIGQWQYRLGEKTRPRVGLAWSGGTTHQHDHHRSIPLVDFSRLVSGQAQFISLQKDVRAADRVVLDKRGDIADFSADLRDFAETAGLIANLDLIISVDTAVAHLAGALGKPVWILLPFNADWRWLQARNDSPWYPTARLYRQEKIGDWNRVIASVAESLSAFCGKKTNRLPPKPPHPPAEPIDPAKVEQAIALHQQGRLPEAEALYQEILQANPKQFDALHLLGVIALQAGQVGKAVNLIRQALCVDDQQAAAHSNLGNALQRLGRSEEALACYDRALQLQPAYAEALNNRGIALRSLNRVEEAIASYQEAVRLRQGYAEAHSNLGAVLQQLDRWEEARASYTQALLFAPDDIETFNSLGIVLRCLKRPEEAKAVFERVLQLAPGYLDALNNSGAVLLDMKRSQDALACYEQVLRHAPDFADGLYNRGVALQNLHRHEEALASYDQAIQLMPEFPDSFNNRGLVLQELNRGEEALESYARAIQLKPDLAVAHWNNSLSLLLQGDFEQGWQEYEWRWQVDGFPSPKRYFTQPLWLGQASLQGKTILLHAEQGLGDTLQFCRYATLVAKLGATVVLETQPSLQSLLARVEGVSRTLAYGEALPRFDYHCPLLSLPLAFQTRLDTIPAATPYLSPDPERVKAWQARLGNKRLPRIGLVWSGNPDNSTDYKRSIPPAQLSRLVSAQAQFISLHNELREEDSTLLANCPDIAYYGDALVDFAETAALVAQLDWVIAVDTSTAHLAAALGKPVWLLLSFNPDWRWLLGRSDSPWYPSMTLFRQTQRGDWDGVLAELARALDKFCQTSR